MERKSYIYVLVHLETNKVFYVGRGTQINGKACRYQSHLHIAKKGSLSPVHRKIRELQNANQHIHFGIISNHLTFEESMQQEKNLIAAYGLDNLTNISPGGDDLAWLRHSESAPHRDTYKWTTEQKVNARGVRYNSRAVFLRDVKTQKVTFYLTLSDAARALNVDPSAVRLAFTRKGLVRGCVVAYSEEELPTGPKRNYKYRYRNKSEQEPNLDETFKEFL